MSEERPAGPDAIDVAYVARLARLSLTPDEERLFQGQLDHILEHVRKIRELDVSGIEPTSHAVAVSNVFRADEVREGLERESVLANAPGSSNGLFLVPKILD